MLLRVAGLSKIAPYFPYFRDVITKRKANQSGTPNKPANYGVKRRVSLKDKIIYKAMVSSDYL
jgi:hypothetical protein